MRDRLFFVVSGEHRTLPHAEIRAILQASKIDFKETSASMKLLRVDADISALELVARRSMMYDQCGIEIASTTSSKRRFFSVLRDRDLSRHFAKRHSFAVRSVRIGGAFKKFRRTALEREIGEILRTSQPGIKVNLDCPEVTFLCVISSRGFLLGEVTHSRTPGLIASRRPRKRPVFHPSTMPPKLARCLVNLSRPSDRAMFLDPFCGVGGILLEAVGVGCNVVGLDADLQMVKGARANLSHYGSKPLGLIVGDATKMPMRSMESIATDPPYGRESSTRGRRLETLIRDFLPSAHTVLSRGGHLCICCPSELQLIRVAGASGFEVKESHVVYIHRSLTRRILVLRKK